MSSMHEFLAGMVLRKLPMNKEDGTPVTPLELATEEPMLLPEPWRGMQAQDRREAAAHPHLQTFSVSYPSGRPSKYLWGLMHMHSVRYECLGGLWSFTVKNMDHIRHGSTGFTLGALCAMYEMLYGENPFENGMAAIYDSRAPEVAEEMSRFGLISQGN